MKLTKDWYKSKGVLGGLGATIASIAGIAGYNVNPEDINTIMINISLGISAIGGILSAFGRITAKAEIR